MRYLQDIKTPIHRGASYDFNVQLDHVALQDVKKNSPHLTDESLSVKEHEIVFRSKSRQSSYKDKRLRVFSNVAKVNKADVEYVGVAITPQPYGRQYHRQDAQGFACTRGGLNTIRNTGNHKICAGDRVYVTIPDNSEFNSGEAVNAASHSSLGIPVGEHGKVLACTVPTPSDKNVDGSLVETVLRDMLHNYQGDDEIELLPCIMANPGGRNDNMVYGRFNKNTGQFETKKAGDALHGDDLDNFIRLGGSADDDLYIGELVVIVDKRDVGGPIIIKVSGDRVTDDNYRDALGGNPRGVRVVAPDVVYFSNRGIHNVRNSDRLGLPVGFDPNDPVAQLRRFGERTQQDRGLLEANADRRKEIYSGDSVQYTLQNLLNKNLGVEARKTGTLAHFVRELVKSVMRSSVSQPIGVALSTASPGQPFDICLTG